MRQRIAAIAALAAAASAVPAVGAWAKASPSQHRQPGRTITVIEHASTDATTDSGAPGDSAGDILTFANELFDATDTRKVGTNQGYCMRVVPGTSYECTWTAFLPGGQIVVSGPFYDAKSSTLAITGGTGRYRNARGTMDLQARENGTKFAFAYHVIG